MLVRTPNTPRRVAHGFAIFVVSFVLSVFLFPLMALAAHDFLPRQLVNGLFFWPQLLLIPYGLRGEDYYYGYGTLGLIAAAFWLVLAIAFGWLLRNWGAPLKAFAVFPFILLVTVSVYFLLGFFGLGPNLEGF